MQIRLSKEYTELDGCFRRCRTVLFLRSAVKTRKTKTQKGFLRCPNMKRNINFSSGVPPFVRESRYMMSGVVKVGELNNFDKMTQVHGFDLLKR